MTTPTALAVGFPTYIRNKEGYVKDLELQDQRVFEMVRAENKRQVKKWGVQDRHPFEWLAYATEEHGELAQAISEYEYRSGKSSDVVKEAIQAATLHLKIAEMFLARPKPDKW